ncbi:hypothetical protein ACLB2K_048508 [Fragaria x ananassa]
MSVHFPRKFPNISLQCRAAVVSPAPDFPHARGGPDVSLYRFKLPFLLPFLPDDTEVVEVVILDNTGDAFNHLFQHINEEHNDENGMPRRNDRIGSVALVLGLSVLTTFSVDDVVGFLKPRLIDLAPDVGWFIWERWGPLLALTIADQYVPWLSPIVIGFIRRLSPRTITLLPPGWIALLPPSTIETLPRSYIETLPPSCIETLSPSCIETLSPSCIKTLSPSFIARLPRSCIDSLTLQPGTQMEVQLIILQRMVDALSLRVADLVPSVPVPFVIFAIRFGISFGFCFADFCDSRHIRDGSPSLRATICLTFTPSACPSPASRHQLPDLP